MRERPRIGSASRPEAPTFISATRALPPAVGATMCSCDHRHGDVAVQRAGANSVSRSVRGAVAARSIRAASCSRSCSSLTAARYSAVRSRAESSAFAAAAIASAPCGLCLTAAVLLGLVRPPGLRLGFLGPAQPPEGAGVVLRRGLLHGLERGEGER
ncbi:hypothetical protein GCM10010345_19610 [Streptomyces canarius]|uniref:Uncharacterized protein n=1 Tax=Streptomyces canarius TaxID=285453 RepID=A0ABQ3CJK6_9ACTN|nr:hypothetical protein GCM10010345_19610 [Streptomyces canarius]